MGGAPCEGKLVRQGYNKATLERTSHSLCFCADQQLCSSSEKVIQYPEEFNAPESQAGSQHDPEDKGGFKPFQQDRG